MGAWEFGLFEILLCVSFLLFLLCFRQCRDYLFVTKSEELQSAVENLDLELTRSFLEEDWRLGCWWRSESGETLLHRCLFRNSQHTSPFLLTHMCRLLVTKGKVDCGLGEQTFGLTALHLACRYNLEPVAKFLLTEAGASAWAISHTELTPAHLACTRGALEIMRLLAAKEGTRLLHQKDAMGLNPLYYAASRGHMDLVHFLVLSEAQISFASIHAPCWKRPVVRQNLIFACALMYTQKIKKEARESLQSLEPYVPPELQDLILAYICVTTWEEACTYLTQKCQFPPEFAGKQIHIHTHEK